MGRVCPLPVTGVTGKKEENDMKRRIISVLLALVLVLSLLPTTVLATQPDAVPEGETLTQADSAQQNDADDTRPVPAVDGEENVLPEEQPADASDRTEETVPLPRTEEQPQQVPDAGEEQQEAVPVMSSGANAHHHCV